MPRHTVLLAIISPTSEGWKAVSTLVFWLGIKYRSLIWKQSVITITQTQVCNMQLEIVHTSAQQVFTHWIYFNHCCIPFNEQIIKSHHPVCCLIQASFTETHFPGKLQGIWLWKTWGIKKLQYSNTVANADHPYGSQTQGFCHTTQAPTTVNQIGAFLQVHNVFHQKHEWKRIVRK